MEISLIFQQNSEELYIFWRISENRNIVAHGNFIFEGRNTANFQSHGHRYCLDSSVMHVKESIIFWYLNLTSDRLLITPILFALKILVNYTEDFNIDMIKV